MAHEGYSRSESVQPKWAVISVYVIFATVIVSWLYVIMVMKEMEQYGSSPSVSSAMAAQVVDVASSNKHSQDRF